MLFGHVATITVSSQSTSIAFQQSAHFRAPFLFILFKMLFRTLAFPVWFFIKTLVKLCQGKRLVLIDTWRHCEEMCAPQRVTWSVMLWKFTPTALTMLLMQIGYTLGLMYLLTSMTTALYCSAVAISYGMTWVFFKRSLLLIKVSEGTLAF
ncbi:hypothetical protein BV898_11449 [Hypsibius exemplaris]|uniref:Uncharacterized protein n=1 Tax=Hypsibius exemplaris TaxID=2072580 RepID=A0A1W0WGJ9_HYPEX|nr:hypothetical protein BV898_11449 [Hypsibius exemplaris]